MGAGDSIGTILEMAKKISHAASAAAHESAQRVIPGGVNSPVRAFGGVGGTPVFMARGQGSRVTDIDGNTYIDYLASWGPLILGHAAPEVVAAVKAAVEQGSSSPPRTLCSATVTSTDAARASRRPRAPVPTRESRT